MKHAAIKVGDSKTLSRIVQELAFKAAYKWADGSIKGNECSLPWLQFGQFYSDDGQRTIRHGIGDNIDKAFMPKHWTTLDAATQMDKVIAFFEQPASKEVRVGSHRVTINADGSVTWSCGTKVESADVEALIKARAELLKEVA